MSLKRVRDSFGMGWVFAFERRQESVSDLGYQFQGVSVMLFCAIGSEDASKKSSDTALFYRNQQNWSSVSTGLARNLPLHLYRQSANGRLPG